MSKIVTFIDNILSPPRCVGCSDFINLPVLSEMAQPLCPTCLSVFEAQKQAICNRCQKCVAECTCSTEMMQSNGIPNFLKLNYYDSEHENVQDKILYQIKKYPDKRLFSFCTAQLSARLFSYLKENQSDPMNCVLCYLPRSDKAILEHGFDQAEKLTHDLSRLTGIPFYKIVKRKKNENTQQKTLTVSGRQENAKKAFNLSEKQKDAIQNKTVILVDDMVTTGAGMSVVGKMLLKNGAKAVVGLALSASSYNRDFHEKSVKK